MDYVALSKSDWDSSDNTSEENDLYYHSGDYYYVLVDVNTTSDPHMFQMEQDIIEKTLLPIVSCGGIIGIILTVIVLSRKTMSTSTNCYLTALASADFMFLVLMLVGTLTFISTSSIIFIIRYFCGPLMAVFNFCSIWITVMLAVERYIAICHPFKALRICSLKHARMVIAIVYFFSFILRLPMFFNTKINFFDVANSSLQVNVVPTALGNNILFQSIYSWTLEVFLTAILPLFALLLLNCRLIHEIRRSTRYLRYHLAVNNTTVNSTVIGEEKRITLMLITIIIVFMICQGPYVAHTTYVILEGFKRMEGEKEFTLIRSVLRLLVALKSSFNFIVYCWFSEKFWVTFKGIVCLRYCASKVVRRKPGEPCMQQTGTKMSCPASTRETTNV